MDDIAPTVKPLPLGPQQELHFFKLMAFLTRDANENCNQVKEMQRELQDYVEKVPS